MFIVIGKYQSKYGLIVYAVKSNGQPDFSFDLSNCYINTLYYKGHTDIIVGESYDFQTVKGENGLTYCFL